ncbi:hypothetical protein Xen7305DRAFT_00045620 [Xenococcus sp. PCC 7305]|uniref:hypothetical protein n=1 Tax=Xenococcus sp. PCC 7305 TaxID=102125 RepID=UPI0002ACBBE4|nr:hypothetical protein [Xenococcus sp. PCC 7305]ELS04826.1 hypothetical protein Xen7305DRAFT_00045620 [Xenococcus sp. PCC 7305]
MEVKTITYKRVHNLGDYNTEHLEMMAELSPEDNPQESTKQLIAEVETALGLKKPPVEESKKEDNVPW